MLLGLRVELVLRVRPGSLAQSDLKETVESPVCLDMLRRVRRESLVWWWGLMGVCSDWKVSVDRRATEEPWAQWDLQVRMVLKE